MLLAACYIKPAPLGSGAPDSNDIIKQSQSVKEEESSPVVVKEPAVEVVDNTEELPQVLPETKPVDPSFPLVDWKEVYESVQGRQAGGNTSDFELLKAIPGTELALSIVADGEVRLWNIESNRSYFLCEIGADFRVADIHVARGLLIIGQTGSIELYDVRDCQRVAQQTRVKTRLGSLSFAPDGLSVVAAGYDGKVYRWRFAHELNSQSFKERQLSLERYFGHSASVGAVAIHPEGRVFFSGDTDGIVNAWLMYDSDRFQGRYDKSDFGFKGHVESALRATGRLEKLERIEVLRVSETGRRLLVAAQDGNLEVWKVRGFLRETGVEAHSGLIYDAAFRPGANGDSFFTLGRDGYIRLWEIEENKELKTSKIRKVKEISVVGARIIAGLRSDSLLVGIQGGRLIEVQLKN